MAHEHSVYDDDKHFSIDPETREIKNESGKFVLIQYDHNSERITFEIPKEVDGHDMSLCNVVQIHYINIEGSKEPLTYEGICDVEDLRPSPDNPDMLIGSWLISRNATQYVGTLNFVVYFSCVAEDGTIEYAWSTDIHKDIKISSGIYNSEVIVGEYADILEQWRAETFRMVQDQIDEAVQGEAYVKKTDMPMYFSERHFFANCLLSAAGWVGEAAPYTQTVQNADILETDRPHYGPIYSENAETALLEKEGWSLIDDLDTAEGSVTFTCFEEKPVVDIMVQLEVHR